MQSSQKSGMLINRSIVQKLAWWFKAALAVVLAVVIWELLLGQLILQKPTSRTDPVLGRIYGQGLYVQGKEGYGRTVLNELGLRGPSLKEQPLGAQRVLVLGDSYTQAMQVADHAAFPQRLHELLGEDTEVVNAGREGASPADYIALADYNQQTFNPDVVVVQLNEADFTRDLLSKNQTFYYEKTAQGYTLEENKAAVSSNALATRFASLQGVLNFSVIRVVLERVEAMRSGASHEVAETAPVETDKWGDGSLEQFIVQELKRTYTTPLLLYIPEMDYFSEDFAAANPTEQYLYEAAREAGVPFISLRSDFVTRFSRYDETAHGFANTQPGMGHMNALGHKIAARRLAGALQLPVFENSLSEVKR
jgi:lysophospholipase L1-like esterase